MLTAEIKRIGVDAEGRYLVTATDDKTVRVWALSTGELLRVLRPPIGEGDEGTLYAVALSPDGCTVATGGWTGEAWDQTYSIYLFERASGQLLRRLNGLRNRMYRLTYSPDGRWLAATRGEGNGLRLYRTSDYALVGEDRSYGDRSLGAAFDAASRRLVTSSYDGWVRLYAVEASPGEPLRLLAKERPMGHQS
ncbi:MAG: WD40 repeat domain-containing protein [Candidatus Entotheonellia bacterium]